MWLLLLALFQPLYSPYNKTPGIQAEDERMTYEESKAWAIKQKLPLLTVVGMPDRPVIYASAIVCHVEKLPGCGKCFIIGRPHPGIGMEWVATLPATATDNEIHESLKQTRRQPQLQPQLQRQPQMRQTTNC